MDANILAEAGYENAVSIKMYRMLVHSRYM